MAASRALLMMLLLVAATLAGCAGDEGAGPDADAGEDGFDDPAEADLPEDEPPTGDAEPAPDTSTPAARLRVATDTLSEPAQRPDRILMSLNSTGGTVPAGGYTLQEVLLDAERHVAVSRHVSARATGTPSDEVAGMVGRSGFRLQGDQMRLVRDNASKPFERIEDLPEQTGYIFVQPEFLVVASGLQVLALGTPESEDVEYRGVEAEKLTYHATREGVPDGAVYLQKAPLRLLRAEVVQDPGANSNQPVRFANLTVLYDDEVAHPLVDVLLRAEALAFEDAAGDAALTRVQQGYEEDNVMGWNWTILPREGGARVPLDEVSARVLDRYGDGVTMALENATQTDEDERVQVTFEDVDGDGHVSEGDLFQVLVLTKGSNRFDPLDVSDFEVALLDEKTGIAVTA